MFYRLAQHVTYVHQHEVQPPSQFEPLDVKLMRCVCVCVRACVRACVCAPACMCIPNKNAAWF